MYWYKNLKFSGENGGMRMMKYIFKICVATAFDHNVAHLKEWRHRRIWGKPKHKFAVP